MTFEPGSPYVGSNPPFLQAALREKFEADLFEMYLVADRVHRDVQALTLPHRRPASSAWSPLARFSAPVSTTRAEQRALERYTRVERELAQFLGYREERRDGELRFTEHQLAVRREEKGGTEKAGKVPRGDAWRVGMEAV